MLVVGLGNRLRRDDAAGLEVARRLRRLLPASASVLEWGVPIPGLLEHWAGEDSVIIVDAMKSGGRPGTLRRFDATADPLPIEALHFSSHGLGLAETVALARTLGRLPDSLVVWGIEGASFEPGENLHPEVEKAVERVVRRLAAAFIAPSCPPAPSR